jgi:lipoprotein NlpD
MKDHFIARMWRLRRFGFAGAALLAAVLAGCATVNLEPAPISERSRPAAGTVPPPPPPVATDAAASAPAAPGGYVVKSGDTLYSIALAFGRDYRELARWNGLDDPARLKVGQTLRVQPPAADDAAAAAAANSAVAVTVPLGAPAAAPAPAPAAAPAAAQAAAPAAVASNPTLPAVAPLETGAWVWPTPGSVIAPFDDPRNKGIDIGGHEGDPVVAANDGTVVYSGNGLRGYGNLVIIKHSDDFISAYAHNREIVVGQGQAVKRGQRIAVLGKTEAESPRLHFEIRRQGKPVDPVRYLPAR